MALASTLPLTETNARILLVGKRQPAFEAEDLTAICEPIE
jgi:hypothetical protein